LASDFFSKRLYVLLREDSFPHEQFDQSLIGVLLSHGIRYQYGSCEKAGGKNPERKLLGWHSPTVRGTAWV
jgi:hypothetical protein